MTTLPPFDDREQFAAEHALGVLDANERVRAERMVAEDEAFAAMVAAWHGRLAPLIDEIAPVDPDAALWPRIRAAVEQDAAEPSNVVPIERALRRWKGVAATFGAIAAALALVLINPSDPGAPTVAPPALPTAPAMTASIAAPDAPASFMVAYAPGDKGLTVMPATIKPVAGHDHQLWLIPEGGKPMPLGVISAARPMRMTVSDDMVPMITGGAVLAVSAEPLGGSPTGQPTGPVIGSGKLQSV